MLAELIKLTNRTENAPILVETIKEFILSKGLVDSISFTPAPIDENKVKGFIHWHRYKPPYGEENTLAEIFYAESLNPCWKRFVCAKELIHLLAPNGTHSVNDGEKLKNLLLGITNNFCEKTDIGAFDDVLAEFFALPVLVPLPLLELVKEKYDDKKINEYGIAVLFRIPEKYVPILLTRHYVNLYNIMGGFCDSEDFKVD